MNSVKEIHIGTTKARILTISKECIVYLDEAAVEECIDLILCNQKLNERFSADWQYVGFRKASMSRESRVSFNDGEQVRFIFESYEDIYVKLLNPLREAGWSTLDMT